MVLGGASERGATVLDRCDLVAGGVQGDPQRARQLRVVVDDEHPRHRGGVGSGPVGSAGTAAAFRATTMVRPPPDVSSAVSVPDIASVRPRATARPRPTP